MGGGWALEIKTFLGPEMATPPVHKILLIFRRCRERTVTALQRRRQRNSRIFLSPAILPLIARFIASQVSTRWGCMEPLAYFLITKTANFDGVIGKDNCQDDV